VMMALGAVYRVKGSKGERDIPARDFYRGSFTTALAAAEILTQVRIPAAPKGQGYAYEKQKRKVGDYATAAAAVVLSMAQGSCAAAAIGLTNVGGTPLFAAAAAQALIGTRIDGIAIVAAVREARAIAQPAADQRGPADFRTHVAGVMVERAIRRAKERSA